MTDNIIRIDFTNKEETKRLAVPWDSVRNFVFSFGYNPDDTEELNEFIYQAFDLIVQVEEDET